MYSTKGARLNEARGYDTGRTREQAFYGVHHGIVWVSGIEWADFSLFQGAFGLPLTCFHLVYITNGNWKTETTKHFCVGPCGKSVRGGVASQGLLPSVITPELRFSFWAAVRFKLPVSVT